MVLYCVVLYSVLLYCIIVLLCVVLFYSVLYYCIGLCCTAVYGKLKKNCFTPEKKEKKKEENTRSLYIRWRDDCRHIMYGRIFSLAKQVVTLIL